jgi:hypothetical protein
MLLVNIFSATHVTASIEMILLYFGLIDQILVYFVFNYENGTENKELQEYVYMYVFFFNF